ncbi:MAG: ABC transporter permease subunit [Dehalococcoidia bacterium]
MTNAPPAGGAEASSSIYDLGYRRYEGERLGRRHALLALYIESLRGAFGLGRSTAAKVAPAVLIGIAVFPALVQLIIAALIADDLELIEADEYYNIIKYVLALYCAVIAPDIAGRDQRNRSLTLYFSRAISRTDYALGKLAAMTTAMLMITLVPQMVLFIGNALSTQDFGMYVRTEWDQVGPIVASALLGSALIASVGVVIAAQTPHRAFATVGIIVAFILPFVIAGIMVHEIATEATRYAVFLSPVDLIDGFTAWLFREQPEEGGTVMVAGYALWTYAPVALAVTLAATALLVRRYRGVQA